MVESSTNFLKCKKLNYLILKNAEPKYIAIDQGP